ncbi:MAG: GatB/YqeY domain-containing protein [Desulfovibrio aminophilus]|uniref:GatB/YqeY domain-containing protein n=1 Tax=Desulfovibrio aminophilus TaxID=81425 RepID=UPI002A43CACB|nr:GatB/YqeY domain-containing protein [Desulfovibrionaceae bacterium]
MGLQARIESDFVAAYKAKESVKVAVLRMLKTAIKNRQVELCRPLEDGEILDVIAKQVKQRRESIEQFNAGHRPDLAEKEAAELEQLADYLPKALSDEELAAAVDTAIAALGASGLKDMGRVMQAVTEAHKGQVDGKKASALVRGRLSA